MDLIGTSIKISKKSLNNSKTTFQRVLIITIMILGLAIVGIYFFVTPKSSPIKYYKISITHNDKPLEVGPSSQFSEIYFVIALYNRSSSCGDEAIDTTIVNNSYNFDSNSKIGGKELSDFESDGDHLQFYAEGHAPTFGTVSNWVAGTTAKNSGDAELNYNQLPTLSDNREVTFEIPIFNSLSFAYVINSSENKVTIRADLVDSWNKNQSFICELRRNYEEASDSNLPLCGNEKSFVFQRNKECAKIRISKCNIPDETFYVVDAARNDKSINCTFALSDLTKGKSYDIRIVTYKELGPNYYYLSRIKFPTQINIP